MTTNMISTVWCILLVAGLSICAGGCDKGSEPADAAAPNAPEAKVEGLPTPEKGSATLDGLFMIVRFSGSSISQFYFYFTPGGYVYLGIPRGGLDKFDFAEAARTEPEITGTYVIRDDKVMITLADGETRELPYGKDEQGKTTLEGLYAHKAESFKGGKTFDGRYTGGATASGGGAFAASAQTYTFKPDGTYQHSAVGTVQSTGDSTEAGASSTKTDNGTYSVAGNTLTLKHADGTTTRHTIFPYEDYDGNIQLNIDGAMLKPK